MSGTLSGADAAVESVAMVPAVLILYLCKTLMGSGEVG